jgi:hypothetical protein
MNTGVSRVSGERSIAHGVSHGKGCPATGEPQRGETLVGICYAPLGLLYLIANITQ